MRFGPCDTPDNPLLRDYYNRCSYTEVLRLNTFLLPIASVNILVTSTHMYVFTFKYAGLFAAVQLHETTLRTDDRRATFFGRLI